MPSLTTAIGILILGLVRQWIPRWVLLPAPPPVGFAAALSVAFALCFLFGRLFLWRLERARFGRAALTAVLTAHGLCLLVFGGADFEASSELWAAAKYFAAVIPGWAAFAGAALGSFAKAGKRRGFTFGSWFGPRLFFLPQIPFLLLPFGEAFLQDVFPGRAFLEAHPGWQIGAFVSTIVLLLLLGPFVVRALFPTSPLPSSLERNLRALAQRFGVRFRSALVWETGPRAILNACVAGAVSFSRYILVTDALLRTLEQEELEAVFAHELSHVKFHHFPLLVSFLTGFAAALLGMVGLVEGRIPSWSVALIAGGGLGAFLIGPFARVSRILELEADLGALKMGVPPEHLVGALQKLEVFSGASKRRHSWRHFSIPYRIMAVRAWAEGGEFRKSFRRRKYAALATIALCTLAGVFSLSALFLSERAFQGRGRIQRAAIRLAGRRLAWELEELALRRVLHGQWSVPGDRATRARWELLAQLLEAEGDFGKAWRVRLWVAHGAEVPADWRATLRKGARLASEGPEEAIVLMESFLERLQVRAVYPGGPEIVFLVRSGSLLLDETYGRAVAYLILARAYRGVGWAEKARRARRKGLDLLGFPLPAENTKTT